MSIAAEAVRSSTAERAANWLRGQITEGHYKPGEKLSEAALQDELQISRNSLREAFQILTQERLLSYEQYKGVSVRNLRTQDVIDLYRVRTVIECGAISAARDDADLDAVAAAVAEGERAESRADWRGLGSANIHFHQAIVALADSPRLTDMMRGVLAELRLVFHKMTDVRRFHEPYLDRNREILGLLRDGDRAAAVETLRDYLGIAERQLVDEFTRAE